MATFYEALRDTVLSKWMLFAAVTVAVLCIAGVYVTKHYIMPSVQPTYAENNEFVGEKSDPTIDATLFYTTWCPHSKTAVETWLKMKPGYDGSTVNGMRVVMAEVDCDQEPTAADAAGIEEYPTVVVTKGAYTATLDGKPTEESIKALVVKVTGYE
jgi:hypothetical protein